ncbi:hypothetical protein [Streptomyces sp. CB02115]|uniref:hypothetical protein n=1 Tax=Streptomyces sp. CB02115 TaxID=1703939 RepID=UPI0009618DA8|nr:hypothetical protein [Streptomyces sp. CB02115]OKJ46822.1 hypothetical protein AMK28_37165 [Streptomyces sp. CB02115]
MRTNSRRTGRPSLLTPERVDAIVRASAVGAATSLAAEAAGISRATLARWMGRGRDAAGAREDGEPPTILRNSPMRARSAMWKFYGPNVESWDEQLAGKTPPRTRCADSDLFDLVERLQAVLAPDFPAESPAGPLSPVAELATFVVPTPPACRLGAQAFLMAGRTVGAPWEGGVMTTAAFSDDGGDLPEEMRDAQDGVRRAADTVGAGLAQASLVPEGSLAPMAETVQQASRLINSQLPRIDTSFLDDFLHGTLPWQGLPDPMRDTLAVVLDEARTSVEAGEDCDVPEEIVAGLEEQAAQFAASAPALLPPATQKYLFAVFAAASMMMTLMYVSVVSDTANALLDEAYQHGELALILFTAACVAWDRKSGNRRDGVED